MATAIQRRRGNTAQHASFTGLAGEITIDTDKNTVVVHDGSTAGGHPLATQAEVSALGGADITAVVAGDGLTGGATSGNATINVVGGAGITVSADNVAVNTAFYDVTNGGTGWTGNLEPSANNTYSLGSATNVWKDLFVGPNSIRIGGVALSLSNGVLTFGGANVAVAGSASSNADTRALFSATDAGGDGSFSYNSATGAFTYTGPSQAEANARIDARLSGSGGITYNAGAISVNQGYFDKTAGGTGLAANFEPAANNTYSLGSINNVWKDVYVGPGSLYVNGQQVLSDNSGTITVSADAGQNLSLVTSAGGDLELSAGATGDIQLKSNVTLAAGKTITASGGLKLASNIDANSQYINNLSAPVANGDAATKGYVDGATYLSAGDGISKSTGTFSVDNTVVRTTGTQTIGGAKTFSSDLVVSGNLTVSGTTTTVNSETISLADNIIDLNSNFTTGSPTENAGIRIKRGDSADVQLRWNEADDKWQFTNDGSTYQNMLTDSAVRSLVSATDAGGLGSFSYDNGTGAFTYTGPSNSDIRGLFSATDSGGDGSFSYDSATGAFTYTGPSATEVRAHFSAGTGVTLSSGQISIGQAVGTTANVTFNQVTAALVGNVTGTVSSLANHDTADLAEGANLYFTAARARGNISVTDAGGDGSLSYDSGTGVITYTGPSASEVRAHFSAGTGVTITNGSIAIGQAVATTSDVTFKNVSTTGDITVSGNLVVNGTTTTINATELAIQDNMIYLNDESNVTNPDIGIVGNYNDGTYAHTGVFRDATDNRWKFFKGLTVEPGQEINTAHASFALSDVQASTFYGELTGNVTGTVSSIANHSTTNLAEGTNLYYTTARANSAIDARLNGTNGVEYSSGTISLASTTAGAGLTFVSGVLGVGAGAGIAVNADNVALSTSGVSAGTYGTATVVPQFTVDAYGRITSVSNVTISADITSVTAGSYLTGGGSTGDVTLNVDATTTATANKVAARDASGDLYANIFQGTASSARYADLAERYEADAILEPGTVVCFGGAKEITACDHENDHAVAGVVSTDPAYMMNSAAGNNDTHPYIALTGRVPVKVVGPVAKGDLLVASGVKGHAMANNNAKAGTIIGKAIGSIDSGEGVVEALINLM